MNAGNLADRLEVWGFEDEFILFADGSIGFALELKPLDVSSLTTDGLNEVAEKCRQFLNGLPEKIDIQFVQEIKAGNDKVIGGFRSLGKEAKTKAAKWIADERSQYLSLLDKEGLLPVHGIKVFVRRKFNQSLVERPSLFGRVKAFEAIADDHLSKEISLTKRVRSDLASAFEGLSIETKILESEIVLSEMYEQWNPCRPVGLGHYDPENIRDSLLVSDVVSSKKGFSIYDMEYRVLSLKNLPDYTFATIASQLRSLPFDSKVFLSIHVPNQQSEIDSLQTQRRIAFSMASKSNDGVSDLESTAKFKDLETLLEEMVSQGERVFHFSLNILLRARDEETLESQVSQTLGVLRDLAGAEGLVESYAAFDMFSEFSIPNGRCKERSRRLKTSNLADLLPIYGPWPGHRSPSILLRSRMGNLLAYNPFEAGPNANQLISGGSGSGKSFLTNLLILQMLKENPTIFFVDIGGSYKKLCDNLDGQYVPLGVDQNISINPFELGENETTPSSHQIKFLVGLVELMAKEDEQKRLPRLVRAELENCIQSLYESQSRPQLSNLVDILSQNEEKEVQHLSKVLKPWCGDTAFGKFVDRPTNVSLDKDVVAFDLKGLESFPELQTVCLYLITNLIWMEIQKNRYQKKFLVFDECWALLKDPAACDFIESVFRTCRKYNTSAVALSQAVDDFAKSKIADAILPNCTIKWVLMQQQSNGESLKQILQLNETEIQQVKSLSQKKGEFSEAFLMAGKDRAIAVIEALPIEMWLSTTHPKDLALIEKTQEEFPHLSTLDVLKKLSEEYPSGAAV